MPATTDLTQPSCFVVMGFGKKTDFETGRVLDLNMSYESMIKPAVEKAGLTCIRADEIVHSELIDVPMYEQLLNADVVIADLSTSNRNAYYELGLRHALRPYTTIIIAEDGAKDFPFDVNHVLVRQYHHLGEDIGTHESARFQQVLVEAIQDILGRQPDGRYDSPVYTLLHDLVPPALRKAVEAAAEATQLAAANGQRAAAAQPPGSSLREEAAVLELDEGETDLAALGLAVGAGAATPEALSHAALVAQAGSYLQAGHWLEARQLLETLRARQARQAARQQATVAVHDTDHEDPCLLQHLALATYQSEQPTAAEALEAARDLLAPLNPATTNDPETLALWGAIHRRRWHLARQGAPGPGLTALADLDAAVRAYARAFYLRHDLHDGTHLAGVLNRRAAERPATPEGISDFVRAQQVRREVLTLVDHWLADNPMPAPDAPPASHREAATRYWVLANRAEAFTGLGQDAEAAEVLTQATALAPDPWMLDTTRQQLDKLRVSLAANPLQYVRA